MPVSPLPFPNHRPKAYRPLAREPQFLADRHLALEALPGVWTLEDLGYDERTIANCPTNIAVAGPFRLLSNEGVDAIREVALALRDERTLGNRTAAFLTGGVYRSRFLRELCQSPAVTDFLSRLTKTALAPHSLPSQQAYINYAPEEVTQAVDTWHVDSIGLDYVLMISDPSSFEGGEFQFFRGTLGEAADMLGAAADGLTAGYSRDLPNHRVETLEVPGPGYAWFQQGNLVLHRATRLARPAERMTMVVGYVPLDIRYSDATKVAEIATWGEPGLLGELARHGAWLSAAKLQQLIDEPPTDDDPKAVAEALEKAIGDVERLIAELRPPRV